MRVHIVYAHPTHDGFTGQVLDAFVAGLDEAGHRHTISDLYAMGFDPVLSAEEYRRESARAADRPVPDEVVAEQAKLDAADAWVFIYPVWWTDAPAILKGWFDRVWTVGYAYGPDHLASGVSLSIARLALVLCTAGHTEQQLRESGCWQAMATTMLTDRVADRAVTKQFIVLGGSAELDPEQRRDQRAGCLAVAQRLGRELRYRTYVEMTSPRQLVPSEHPAVIDLVPITGDEARGLMMAIGADWHWPCREWDEAAWQLYLAQGLRYHRIDAAGAPAGLAVLDLDHPSGVEIETFGLLPARIGHRLGGAALTAVTRLAWDCGARRVWLHTSSRDHPHALLNYLARGFREYDPSSSA